MTLGTRAIKWNFIVAEIGDDEGKLGNDFAMAHELTVSAMQGRHVSPNPFQSEGGAHGTGPAMYHPVSYRSMGDTGRNPCSSGCGTGNPGTAYRHTSASGRPHPKLGGTVMIETGPGPLGLCPVRGVVKVEQDNRIRLANTGPQPIRIVENEVVAMAECITAGPGTSPGE